MCQWEHTRLNSPVIREEDCAGELSSQRRDSPLQQSKSVIWFGSRLVACHGLRDNKTTRLSDESGWYRGACAELVEAFLRP